MGVGFSRIGIFIGTRLGTTPLHLQAREEVYHQDFLAQSTTSPSPIHHGIHSFPLLALPLELRRLIYSYLVPSHIRLQAPCIVPAELDTPANRAARGPVQSISNWLQDIADKDEEIRLSSASPFFNLLSSFPILGVGSHAITTEFLATLYEECDFRFEGYSLEPHEIQTILSRLPFTAQTRIHRLTFDMWALSQLFFVMATPPSSQEGLDLQNIDADIDNTQLRHYDERMSGLTTRLVQLDALMNFLKDNMTGLQLLTVRMPYCAAFYDEGNPMFNPPVQEDMEENEDGPWDMWGTTQEARWQFMEDTWSWDILRTLVRWLLAVEIGMDGQDIDHVQRQTPKLRLVFPVIIPDENTVIHVLNRRRIPMGGSQVEGQRSIARVVLRFKTEADAWFQDWAPVTVVEVSCEKA